MKDGELVAGYEHNGKTFKIIYYKNSLRCECFGSAGEYYSNFNEEERSILISVIKGLMVDKKRSKFSGYYSVENEMYEIYYDLTSKNYFWYSSSGVNNVNHNAKLNKLFNNVPDVVYKKDATDRTYQKFKLNLYKELKRYYGRRFADSIWDENDITRMALYVDHAKANKKRGIKKFFIKAGVSLALLAELVALGNSWKVSINNDDNSFYNSTEYSYVDTQTSAPVEIEIEIDEAIVEEKVEYSWDIVKDAIESNPNLTDVEKKFLLELRFVFDECHQYMNLDLVISRLSTLCIYYKDEIKANVGGEYYPFHNSIIMYKCSSFENCSYRTLLHEVGHVFQDNSQGYKTYELSNMIFEADVLKRLHFNGGLERLGIEISENYILDGVVNYSSGGYNSKVYFYLLANLLSKETLLQYHFNCEPSLIVNELCLNSINYREDALRAYDLIHNIHDFVEDEQNGKSIDLFNDNIIADLEYFYNLKGMSMITDVDCFVAYLINKSSGFFCEDVGCGVNLEFLMNYVGKEEYFEYSDSILGEFIVDSNSYFFDDSSKTIIYFCFRHSSKNWELLRPLLIENGDLDEWGNIKVYSVVVDEDFELAYSNYIGNRHLPKK